MPDAHREDIDKLESLYAEYPEGRIFTHLAEAYRKAGELDRATEVLHAGIQRHPDYSSAHVVLGRVLMDQDRTTEAEAAFRRVLELDGHNLIALRSLGDLARSHGRDDDALQHYQRLLDVEPANEQVRELVHGLESKASSPEGVDWSDSSAPDLDQAATEEEEAASDETVTSSSTEWEEFFAEHEPYEVAGAAEGRAAEPAQADHEEADHEEADDEEADHEEEDDEAAAPASPAPGVVTETIAQVYARQGLYDRAVEVYRGLVGARPDDTGLRERLEEMEALAASGGAPDTGVRGEPVEPVEPVEDGEAEAAGLESLETGELELADHPDVSPLAGLESHDREGDTGLALESRPGQEAEPRSETQLPGAEGASGEAAEEASSEEVSVWVGGDWVSETEETPYAWAEPEPESGADQVDSPPIRGYLGSLLEWRPAGEPAAEAAPEPQPAPEPGDDDDLDTFRTWLESLKQ